MVCIICAFLIRSLPVTFFFRFLCLFVFRLSFTLGVRPPEIAHKYALRLTQITNGKLETFSCPKLSDFLNVCNTVLILTPFALFSSEVFFCGQ